MPNFSFGKLIESTINLKLDKSHDRQNFDLLMHVGKKNKNSSVHVETTCQRLKIQSVLLLRSEWRNRNIW